MASIVRVWLTCFYALFHKLINIQKPKTNRFRGKGPTVDLMVSDPNNNSQAPSLSHSMRLHVRHHLFNVFELIKYFDSLWFLQVVLATNDMPSINDVTYNGLVEITCKVCSPLFEEGWLLNWQTLHKLVTCCSINFIPRL